MNHQTYAKRTVLTAAEGAIRDFAYDILRCSGANVAWPAWLIDQILLHADSDTRDIRALARLGDSAVLRSQRHDAALSAEDLMAALNDSTLPLISFSVRSVSRHLCRQMKLTPTGLLLAEMRKIVSARYLTLAHYYRPCHIQDGNLCATGYEAYQLIWGQSSIPEILELLEKMPHLFRMERREETGLESSCGDQEAEIRGLHLHLADSLRASLADPVVGEIVRAMAYDDENLAPHVNRSGVRSKKIDNGQGDEFRDLSNHLGRVLDIPPTRSSNLSDISRAIAATFPEEEFDTLLLHFESKVDRRMRCSQAERPGSSPWTTSGVRPARRCAECCAS